jgi:hypothetical protein
MVGGSALLTAVPAGRAPGRMCGRWRGRAQALRARAKRRAHGAPLRRLKGKCRHGVRLLGNSFSAARTIAMRRWLPFLLLTLLAPGLWAGINDMEPMPCGYDFRNGSADPAGYVDGYSLYNGYFVPNENDPEGKFAWLAVPIVTAIFSAGVEAGAQIISGNYSHSRLAGAFALGFVGGPLANWLFKSTIIQGFAIGLLPFAVVGDAVWLSQDIQEKGFTRDAAGNIFRFASGFTGVGYLGVKHYLKNLIEELEARAAPTLGSIVKAACILRFSNKEQVLALISPAGTRAINVIIGHHAEGKIAIIGRNMKAVKEYSNHLIGLGYKTELFVAPTLTQEAKEEITKLQKSLGMKWLPDDVIKTTLAYQQDVKWAYSVKRQSYTLIDIGDPTGVGDLGPFYGAEKAIWFGGVTP